jgi:hypothetical protein
MAEQIEQLAAPSSDSATAVLVLIERAARDPGADAAKLERIIAMYAQLKAKEAELAFNAAKGRILKKLAAIKLVKNRPALYEIDKGRSQKGTYEAFKYAPLEEIDKHLRPLLLEEDMDLSYSDEPREHGWILIRGRLKHLPSGYFEDSFMPAPPDTSGGKSNVQGVGSTNSYLRRYIVCNIFNIVVVGDDDDGNGGTIGRGPDHHASRFDQKGKGRAEVSEIHAGAEHRGSRFSRSRSRDDRVSRLSEGDYHSRGANRQGGGRPCQSFMRWHNTRRSMIASRLASQRAPTST